METYCSPTVTGLGAALENIQFGGIYKNPLGPDNQCDAGYCPAHELDD